MGRIEKTVFISYRREFVVAFVPKQLGNVNQTKRG